MPVAFGWMASPTQTTALTNFRRNFGVGVIFASDHHQDQIYFGPLDLSDAIRMDTLT